MLRYITKPRVSMLDAVFCLLCGLAVPVVGWWLSAMLLILSLIISTVIERMVWDK